MFDTMIVLLDDDRAYDKYKRKSKLVSWDDRFTVTEVNTITKQISITRYVSSFYALHYMSGIVNAMKYNQVLIIPT
jgi:hypothetical protein